MGSSGITGPPTLTCPPTPPPSPSMSPTSPTNPTSTSTMSPTLTPRATLTPTASPTASPTACPPGFGLDVGQDEASANCIPCAPGFFADGVNNRVCTLCNYHFLNEVPTPDRSGCEPCGPETRATPEGVCDQCVSLVVDSARTGSRIVGAFSMALALLYSTA